MDTPASGCALADLEEGVITPVHRIRPGAVPDQNAIDKMGGVLASGGLNRQVPHCIGDYDKSGPRLAKFRAAFDDPSCQSVQVLAADRKTPGLRGSASTSRALRASTSGVKGF